MPATPATVTSRCPDCGSPVDPEYCAGLCLVCLGECSLSVELVPTLPVPDEGTRRWCGEYELLEVLAHGGSGVVWKAQQRLPHRVVALKLIRESWLPGEEEARRFRQEGEAAARLRHPHIVPVYEVGEADGAWFISMALIEGPSLDQRMRAQPYAPREAAALVALIARAVHHAHERGVLHRDLKPANVLVDGAGTPYLTDFGVAKVVSMPSDLTVAGVVFGTPAYMPPEQARGQHDEVTTTSDVYSLGVILYELLTGKVPFDSADPMELLRRIAEEEPAPPGGDRDLQTICAKSLQKRGTARYSSALALAEDLERWQRGEPIRARRLNQLQRLWKWAQRRPTLAALWAVTVGGALAFGVSAVEVGKRLKEERRLAVASAEESRHRLARQFTTRGLSYTEQADWSAALLCFCEALEIGSGEAALDEANRRRYETLVRLSPRLLRMWFPTAGPKGVPLRLLNQKSWSTLLVVDEHGARLWDATTGEPLTAALANPIWPGTEPGEHFAGGVSVNREDAHDRAILAAETGGDRGESFQGWDLETGAILFEHYGTLLPTLHGSAAQAKGICRASDCVIAWEGTTVQKYAMKDGAPIGRPLVHDAEVKWAALAPASPRAFTFTADGMLHLWNGEARVAPPIALPVGTTPRALNAERSLLSLRTGDEQLTLLDYTTGQVAGTAEATGSVLAHGWAGSRWIYAERGSSGIAVRDALTGFALFSAAHGGRGHAAEFAQNAEITLTAAMNGTARMWRTTTGEPLTPILRCSGTPHTMAMSDDGMSAVMDSNEPVARLWRRPDRDGAEHELPGSRDPRGVWFTADGKRLSAASKGGQIESLSLETGQPAGSFDLEGKRLSVFARSSDGAYLALGDEHEMRRVSATGEKAGAPIIAPEKIASAALSPDGTRIALVLGSGGVAVYGAVTGGRIAGPLGEDATECAFSRNGQQILTSGGHSARLWSVASGEPALPPLETAEGNVSAAFGPLGLRILTWTRDRKLTVARAAHLWDIATGAPLAAPLEHRDGITTAEFSADGRWVITGSEDQTARVWDSRTGAPLLPPLMHPATVDRVGFSPDGRYFCTLSNREARIWETKTGEPVTPPLKHGKTESFQWSPDGQRLATIGGKAGVRIWNVAPGNRPVREMRALARLLSSHELSSNGTGAIVPLTGAQLRSAWGAAGRR